MSQMVTFPAQQDKQDLSVARQTPTQYREDQPRARSPLENSQHRPPPHYIDSAAPSSFHPNVARRYRTPESIPTPSSAEPEYRRIHSANNAFIAHGPQNPFMTMPERPAPRRSSINDYDERYPRDEERNHDRRLSHQTNTRFEQARLIERERLPQSGPGEQYLSHPPRTYAAGTYQSGQHAFFMPSHYDYQYGKSRKRSNLPKQSTEIMKTWFDQVTIVAPSQPIVQYRTHERAEHRKSISKRGAKGNVF